jgi:ATP phosphoribosyltransferase
VEVEEIAKITSRLAVNRIALKTRPDEISHWIKSFREAVDAVAA